ncbi:expressed unknown protein [Ectocarpus siliculosus]|uniref:Uncharacterized protein n=1 Tax=Ectocarpus siliculosus TaxID=2880 RepID=D7FWY2_ECTSI|nr:expressed unknown protein [Ectocarpus siliculosus]|eukprot:CBJ32220.1 expressed unknown protein [Ectocarpus siliculosus]
MSNEVLITISARTSTTGNGTISSNVFKDRSRPPRNIPPTSHVCFDRRPACPSGDHCNGS